MTVFLPEKSLDKGASWGHEGSVHGGHKKTPTWLSDWAHTCAQWVTCLLFKLGKMRFTQESKFLASLKNVGRVDSDEPGCTAAVIVCLGMLLPPACLNHLHPDPSKLLFLYFIFSIYSTLTFSSVFSCCIYCFLTAYPPEECEFWCRTYFCTEQVSP